MSERSTRALRLVARRLAYLERVQEAILASFEVAEAARYAVRRRDVVHIVANAVGAQVNNALHREVRAIAERLGARSVIAGNRRLFRGLRVRGFSEAEAQLMTKQLTTWTRERP